MALHLKASFYARPNIITRFYETQTIAFGKNNALRAQKHGLALRHRLWQTLELVRFFERLPHQDASLKKARF